MLQLTAALISRHEVLVDFHEQSESLQIILVISYA